MMKIIWYTSWVESTGEKKREHEGRSKMKWEVQVKPPQGKKQVISSGISYRVTTINKRQEGKSKSSSPHCFAGRVAQPIMRNKID
jgi:hypothetical protein